MTPGNFDWFLHTMLFYHTQHVLEKQIKRNNNTVNHADDSDENDSDDDDSDEEADQIGQ